MRNSKSSDIRKFQHASQLLCLAFALAMGTCATPAATAQVSSPIADAQPSRSTTEQITVEGIYTQEDFDKLLGKPNNGEARERKLKELIQGGDGKAMLTSGIMRSRENDHAGALELYREAAAAGNRRALVNLGEAYRYGAGVPEDEARAFNCFREAAEKGDAWGQFEVGRCMEQGIGTEKSRAALAYYGRAARQGYGPAQTRLGEINRDEGKRSNALHWFRMAADQGETEVFPILASFLLFEAPTKPSEWGEGMRWLKKAGDMTNGWALYKLGEISLHGDFDEPMDPKQAFDYLARSHQAGYPGGTGLLGYCYQFGRGTVRDLGKAVELYRAATAAGHELGIISLAVCYNGGEGVPQDHQKAVELLTPLATAGHPLAQHNLALALLAMGKKGSDLDWSQRENEARAWLQKAAGQGFEPSRQLLKQRIMEAPAEMFRNAGRDLIEEQMRFLPRSPGQ